MARMALRADAARYFLGYLWWVLEPLLFVGVFYVVFEVILHSGRADFLVFLMCGKLVFIWFSKSVNQAANSITANKGLIGRINVTKTLFPLAVIQEGGYGRTYGAVGTVGALLGLLGRANAVADPIAYLPDEGDAQSLAGCHRTGCQSREPNESGTGPP